MVSHFASVAPFCVVTLCRPLAFGRGSGPARQLGATDAEKDDDEDKDDDKECVDSIAGQAHKKQKLHMWSQPAQPQVDTQQQYLILVLAK